MVCPKAVPETLSAADTAYSADKGAINLTSGNQTDRPLLEFFVGHPDGVEVEQRLDPAGEVVDVLETVLVRGPNRPGTAFGFAQM